MTKYGKGLWDAVKAGGEGEAAENLATLQKLAHDFPDNVALKLAADGGGKLVGQLRGVNLVANGTDEFAHWVGGSDYLQYLENGFHGTLFDAGHGLGNPNVEAPENVTDTPHGFAAVKADFAAFKELTTMEVGS